jgi:hypothetical protein
VVPYAPEIEERRLAAVAPRIRVCLDPRRNSIGDNPPAIGKGGRRRRPLSKSHFDRDAKRGREMTTQLKRVCDAWVRRDVKATVGRVLWSTYEPHAEHLADIRLTFVRRGPPGRQAPRHNSSPSTPVRPTPTRRRTCCCTWSPTSPDLLGRMVPRSGVLLSEDYFALLHMVQWLFVAAPGSRWPTG